MYAEAVNGRKAGRLTDWLDRLDNVDSDCMKSMIILRSEAPLEAKFTRELAMLVGVIEAGGLDQYLDIDTPPNTGEGLSLNLMMLTA